MSFFTNFVNKTGIFGELLLFLWKRKLWWLVPVILVLFLLGMLLVFMQSSAVAPFIYTFF